MPQDYVQAHKWFNLSASRSQGDLREYSVKNRDASEEIMTPAQVVEAQKLAREWKPKTWEELSQQKGDFNSFPKQSLDNNQNSSSIQVPPIPDLSGLDRETRSSIRLACGIARGDGPVAYARCLNAQLESIGVKTSK